MRTTSRTRQLGNTLHGLAFLPGDDEGTAQRLVTRPEPRPPLLSARAADLVLMVVALLLAVWISLQNPYMGPAASWANPLIAAVSALPLLVRRRAPELVLAAGLLAKVLQVSAFAAGGARPVTRTPGPESRGHPREATPRRMRQGPRRTILPRRPSGGPSPERPLAGSPSWQTAPGPPGCPSPYSSRARRNRWQIRSSVPHTGSCRRL
ncbi:hypothetical protein [Streptomyces sp. NPDC088400]|uniref:hypothetical protein n=1 Tax=Streptomyces sp. NPDC088400 TaxID=3365861 RepID=UPI0038152867